MRIHDPFGRMCLGRVKEENGEEERERKKQKKTSSKSTENETLGTNSVEIF